MPALPRVPQSVLSRNSLSIIPALRMAQAFLNPIKQATTVPVSYNHIRNQLTCSLKLYDE